MSSDAARGAARTLAAPESAPSDRMQSPGADRFGRTELWWSAREGRTAAVKRLIAQAEDPNARDIDGEAPLHAAARGGHVTVIGILLAAGADARVEDRYGTTPLHVAIAASRTRTAKLLIDGGADVNAPDLFGVTPLHQAALAGDRELATLLLEHGANLAARYRNRSPSELAARAGNEALAQWFASQRAAPLATSGPGALPRAAVQP